MFKLTIFCLFIWILNVNSFPHENFKSDDELVVTLNHGGKVRGTEETTDAGQKFLSFKGIPYAKPPVGDLRLRNTQPHPGWAGTRDATKHGSNCIGQQMFSESVTGSEDCLFLNVYVPRLESKEKLPVMFWIHGGSFKSGSGDSEYYGPEFFMEEEVVIVTINYRLGFLGFFSTNDKAAQGNYGLKDCVEALKWVQNNIEAFGGDREQVTIFGESAGGASVHYLTLSPMANGLFRAAISQSGSALNPWSFQDDPKRIAYEAGTFLNLTFSNTEELVKGIREIDDPKIFVKFVGVAEDNQLPAFLQPIPFSPCVEPEDSEETRFLTETPLTIIQEKKFNKNIKYISGSNDKEMLLGIPQLNANPNFLQKLNENPHFLLPYEWHIDPDSEAAADIIDNIRKVYFHGQNITDTMDFIKYSTDRVFGYGIQKTAQLHSQSHEVFYYIFSFGGDLNIFKKLASLEQYEGAAHADELGYLWNFKALPSVSAESPAATVRTRMVKMWSNFGKFGNPTPEQSELNVIWSNLQSNLEYLNIDGDLESKEDPFSKRMAMWREMDQKYNKK
ncbi:juvenile hormone esterase-like [Culicoides brevitarsis]|uniref:juvenile hormone esterase-like n=1 Tax=Culicoides brevitarsis TaxID=469753 RepID=UPI00307C957B